MSLPLCTVNTNNIQNLPDSPTLSSEELKQEFDRSGKDFKSYLNEILLPEIEKLIRDEKNNLKISINNIIKEEKANLEVSINNKILEDNKKKFHIGKIVMSTSNTNPSEYLGFGTWVLWGSGRVPVGVNESDSSFNTVEKTGGEKSHTLTINEMPAHSHRISDYDWATMTKRQTSNDINQYYNPNGWTYDQMSPVSQNTGGSQAHNNLQPFITCYMWKRTA